MRSSAGPSSLALRFKVLATALMAAAVPLLSAGESVAFAWDPSPDATVTGYALHYGQTSGSHPVTVTIGNALTGSVGSLVAGQTYYFVVTAYNAAGVQSEPSNEVAYVVPSVTSSGWKATVVSEQGMPRVSFQVTAGRTYHVEASADLKTWSRATQSITASSDGTQDFYDENAPYFQSRFYRIVQE